MNTYPVVSKDTIIDLFHFFLYWRSSEKQSTGISPAFWFTNFELFARCLVRLSVIPARRFEVLKSNRDFVRAFESRILVIQQSDPRDLTAILGSERRLPFAVRITTREQINGNTVDKRDLLARRRIFITARGMACGPIIERSVSHLASRSDFGKIWAEMTTKPIPGFVYGIRSKEYTAWLEGGGEDIDHP